MSFPRLFQSFVITTAILSRASGDVLFSSGFETTEGYVAGNDTIIGTNHWLGTTSAGTGRSGIDAESAHGVPGLGNAGWIGGNTTPVVWAGNSTNVRRPVIPEAPFDYAPLSSGKEVVFISALVGIKDSSGAAPLKRDNFELFIMNGAATATGSGDVLAAIQFDNTTLTDGSPQQVVRRTLSSTGTKALSYVSTGAYFIYDTMQLLTVRINFRTNLWTATLDGVPLFNDIPFYEGSGALNLGAVGFRMFFGSAVYRAPNYTCTGGDNYLLFDDLAVQADALTDPVFSAFEKKLSGSAALTWNAEAGYNYQVFGSPDLSAWSLLTPTALNASQTSSLSFTDSSSAGRMSQFYKVARTFP